MNNELQEPLHSNREHKFAFDIPTLCYMFHPDNINTNVDGQKISQSIHKYWEQLGGPAGLAQGLKTNLKVGIEGDKQDLSARQAAFGANVKRMPRIRTLWELVCENFEDRILQILLIAATVSLMIGIAENGWKYGWVDGLSIYIAVIIIVTVTSGNNYIKELQFQKLVGKFYEDQVAVIRGGHGETQTIPSTQLVVGDVFKLETGMRVPGDSILIAGTDVATDESSMTGEPEQVEKSIVTQDNYHYNPNPFLLGKTLVVQGQGLALVCAVGPHSRSGVAEDKLSIEDEGTPLQGKLETIANEIGKIGVYVALLTFIAMTINLVVKTLMDDTKSLFTVQTLSSLVNFIIIAITVIVVAVPEGLPLAVTIALAFSVSKMKLENNLVKKLEASETMGGANEICTDKTGTLTKNQMSVMKFYTCEEVFEEPRILNIVDQVKTHELMAEGVLYNCSARIERDHFGILETKGNSTEQGLIKFLMAKNVDCFNNIRKKEDNILQIIPFNSKRKRACTALRHPDDQNKVRVFLKGAPEIIITHCTKYFDASGHEVEMSDKKRNAIISDVVNNNFAKSAYRTMLICYTDLSWNEYEVLKRENNNFATEDDREVLESDMTLVCIYALMDPLRDEIVESARKCFNAGITIRMVTGDNLDTAKAIAIQAGILDPKDADSEYACMEGKTFRETCGDLRQMPDPKGRGLLKEEIGNKQAFRAVVKKLRVLARSTPEDKYMLVTGLKEMGQVVAVTGDGTNDAPALKQADVGFAMGITGTEVAKDACDIVLLDDNFASIVTAVKWGRNIYTNVRKFLQFQLTVNVVAMFIVFLGGAVITDPPLTSVQMLWVNLIMDTFAALALATEPPSDELLNQKPYSRNEKIVTAVMWRNIIGQAIYQASVLVVMLFAGQEIFGFYYDVKQTGSSSFYYLDTPVPTVYLPTGVAAVAGDPTPKCYHYTMIFNTFVFMQVFNEINARKLGAYEYNVFKGFFNNALFLVILIVTIIVQVVMVQYGGKPVRCAPLTVDEHLICLGLGVFSLINGLIVKALLPVKWFERVQMKEEIMTDEEEQQAFTSTFRKSFRQSTIRRVDTTPGNTRVQQD